MQFNVGPWTYQVVISEGELFDEEGRETPGLFIWEKKHIVLSGVAPPQGRFEVLLHELWHAWRFHHGRGGDGEDGANYSASFAAMCIKELQAQGGEKVLMAMDPEPRDPATAPARLVCDDVIETFAHASAPGGGTECGTCHRRFNPGEIVTGKPAFDENTGRLVASRAVYCEGCDEVQEWHEGTMNDGTPNGQPVGKLRRLRGKEAGRWLELHGEAAGVMMA